MFWKRLNPKNWWMVPPASKGPHYILGTPAYRGSSLAGEMSALDRTDAHPDGPRAGYVSFRRGILDEPDNILLTVRQSGISVSLYLEREEAISLAKFIREKFKVVIVEIED